MNPESYRQQSLEDARDALTVLVAAIVLSGLAVYAMG